MLEHKSTGLAEFVAVPVSCFQESTMRRRKCDAFGVEFRYAGDGFATFAGGQLADHAGIQVGIDGHLLARQRVQGKAGRDFGVRTAPWLMTRNWIAISARNSTKPTT